MNFSTVALCKVVGKCGTHTQEIRLSGSLYLVEPSVAACPMLPALLSFPLSNSSPLSVLCILGRWQLGVLLLTGAEFEIGLGGKDLPACSNAKAFGYPRLSNAQVRAPFFRVLVAVGRRQLCHPGQKPSPCLSGRFSQVSVFQQLCLTSRSRGIFSAVFASSRRRESACSWPNRRVTVSELVVSWTETHPHVHADTLAHAQRERERERERARERERHWPGSAMIPSC